MEKLGRDCSDCGEGSSLSHLVEHEVLTSQCLAVHLNYLQEYDWPLLVRSGATVVHCPKSHAYFQYAPFQLERMRALGINVCIATDSLASNTSIDLRSELRMAKEMHPTVPDIDWWRTITINPARALGQEGRLGVIAPNALADLVAFPLRPHRDPFRSLIEGTAAPDLLVVDGKRIISP
jgi:cytosine/adenosine deaminase-related metal-dependent hydrolase